MRVTGAVSVVVAFALPTTQTSTAAASDGSGTHPDRCDQAVAGGVTLVLVSNTMRTPGRTLRVHRRVPR